MTNWVLFTYMWCQLKIKASVKTQGLLGLFYITPGCAFHSSSANHLICSTWSPQHFSTNLVVSRCNPQLQGSCVFATWRRFWSFTALFSLYSDFGVAHGSSVLSTKFPQEEQSKIELLHTHINESSFNNIKFYDLRSDNTVKLTFCIYNIALRNLVPNKTASVCFCWPPTGLRLISRSKGQPDVLVKPKGWVMRDSLTRLRVKCGESGLSQTLSSCCTQLMRRCILDAEG